MTATLKKIGIKSVFVERAEGLISECGKFTYEGKDAMNLAQGRMSIWGRTAPEKGYDKCDFVVTFDDGETYSGRYDLQNTGLSDGGETLVGQMRNYIGFLANLHRPAWCDDEIWAKITREHELDGTAKEAAEFLEKYDI